MFNSWPAAGKLSVRRLPAAALKEVEDGFLEADAGLHWAGKAVHQFHPEFRRWAPRNVLVLIPRRTDDGDQDRQRRAGKLVSWAI